LVAGLLAAVLVDEDALAGVVFDVADFAFLCFFALVVGAALLELAVPDVADEPAAGDPVPWAIRATPEIARAIIIFFIAYLLGGVFRGLHFHRRPCAHKGS